MNHVAALPAVESVAFDLAVHRARADFLEMPGLRLTLDQASRLWSLDAAACGAVLCELVNCRFLTKSAHGTFSRAGA